MTTVQKRVLTTFEKQALEVIEIAKSHGHDPMVAMEVAVTQVKIKKAHYDLITAAVESRNHKVFFWNQLDVVRQHTTDPLADSSRTHSHMTCKPWWSREKPLGMQQKSDVTRSNKYESVVAITNQCRFRMMCGVSSQTRRSQSSIWTSWKRHSNGNRSMRIAVSTDVECEVFLDQDPVAVYSTAVEIQQVDIFFRNQNTFRLSFKQ